MTDGSNGTSPAPGSRLLSKSEILSARDLPEETVDVPEWGGAVRVQGMDVNRRLAFGEFLWTRTVDPATGEPRLDVNIGRSADAAYAALCIVDADGEPMFTLAEVEALGSKSPAALSRVATVARQLSYPDREASIEDLKAQSDGSPSDSLVTSG